MAVIQDFVMLYLQYWHHLTGVCNAADEFFLGSENT
jgi:hypothetical protein